MTGHTSDEVTGGNPDAERATDSQSATRTPGLDRGVVQDSPGTPDAGFADQNGGNGNLSDTERAMEANEDGDSR